MYTYVCVYKLKHVIYKRKLDHFMYIYRPNNKNCKNRPKI